MPEYLSPGVYVEEVPSGNKPIEGVSTSTAGFVGVTERGPVNEPTLVTSYADFTRKFGGYLDHRIFTGNRDVLPYAVEGFFTNGGTRAYITRVVGGNAAFAEVDLYGVPRTNPASTTLAQRVAAGGDTLLLDSGTNIADTDVLLLQDGTRSEYVTATSDPLDTGVRLQGSLHHDQPDTGAVVVQTVTPGTAFTITGDMSAGGGLQLDAGDVAGLGAGDVLRVQDTGDPTLTEFVTIETAATADIVEPGLLFDHPQATTEVHPVTMADAGVATTALDGAASASDFVVQLAATTGLAADQVIAIGGGATLEYQVIHNVVSALSITTTLTEFIHSAGTTVIKQVPLLRIHARHPGQWGNALRVRIAQTSILETTVADNADTGDA
ncbi:MAG: hypothetical protein ACK2UI_06220, partial [Anaerolineae bacterium]